MIFLKRPAFLIPALLLLIACQKEEDITAPDFNVSSDKITINAGDTVKFELQGAPDIISFYSGERGNAYDFAEKDRIYDATASLSFRAARYAGNNSDNARLMYSTDFNGVYDEQSIRQATWIDISDRFHFPDINGSSPVFEDAGEADISDLFPDANTPIYFGWFFTTQENSNRTRFQVQNFQVKGIVAEDEELSGVKYDFVDCDFTMILGEGFQTQDVGSTVPRITTTLVYWDGTYKNTSFKEGWAVSAPIYSVEKINLGPDWAVGIKSTLDRTLLSYEYIYNTPGTYKATFVAANAYGKNKQEVVKQLDITVNP